MNKLKVYVAHSIRGKMGSDATQEYMKANNQKAIKFGIALRTLFDQVEFYVPGDHDEFVMIGWDRGILNETQILEIDCEIVRRCAFVIVYSPDQFISNGVEREMSEANKCGIPILVVRDLTQIFIDVINRQILSYLN